MAANATAPSLSPCQGASRRKLYSMPLSDRKSTRLNSSHSQISYAVLCLNQKSGKKDDSGIIFYSGHWALNPSTGQAYRGRYEVDSTFRENTSHPLTCLYQHLAHRPRNER